MSTRGLFALVPGGVTDRARRSPRLARSAEAVFAAITRPLYGRTLAVRSGPAAGMLLRVDRRSAVWLAGNVEADVQRALRDSLREGDAFLDVGASVGFFTLLAARLVGPAGRVVAFEPEPASLTALRANVAANGLDNVTAVAAAVSRRTAPARLVVPTPATASLTDGADGLGVHAVSVDDYLARHPGLAPAAVKIDVEGHEHPVIEGMATTLSDFRPVVIVEVHGHDRAGLQALAGAGYALRSLETGRPWARAPAGTHVLATPRR